MMPWVAQCEQVPKLSGGFSYEVGKYYIVTKSLKNENTVQVIDIDNAEHGMVITKKQANQIFGRPRWVPDEKMHTISIINSVIP